VSTILNVPIGCPACGHTYEAAIADSIGANRAPWLLDAVLDGSFHRFTCPQCAHAIQVEKEILFTDFVRGHWIGVFPPADEPRYEECGELVTTTFREALLEKAPPLVTTWAPNLRVRVVFGIPDLREKLILWHNDLDDRVVEILKLDLLADRPELIERGVFALRVDGVIAENGALALVSQPFPTTAACPPLAMLVEREAYDAAARLLPQLEAEHRELFAGPYVSMLRYLPRPETATPAPGTPRTSVERRIWRASRA
jgi:hypothetical protein